MADEPAQTPGSDEPQGTGAGPRDAGNGGQSGSRERRPDSRRSRRTGGTPAPAEDAAVTDPATTASAAESTDSAPGSAEPTATDGSAQAEPESTTARTLTREGWAENSRLLLGVSPHVVRGAFVDYDADAEIPEGDAKRQIEDFLNRPIHEDTPGGSR